MPNCQCTPNTGALTELPGNPAEAPSVVSGFHFGMEKPAIHPIKLCAFSVLLPAEQFCPAQPSQTQQELPPPPNYTFTEAKCNHSDPPQATEQPTGDSQALKFLQPSPPGLLGWAHPLQGLFPSSSSSALNRSCFSLGSVPLFHSYHLAVGF